MQRSVVGSDLLLNLDDGRSALTPNLSPMDLFRDGVIDLEARCSYFGNYNSVAHFNRVKFVIFG